MKISEGLKEKKREIQKRNKPKKDSLKIVEPIREKKDIALIKKMLSDKPVDFCYFIFGINSNLRASDLLQITFNQVKELKEGDSFKLREKKTGKIREIWINRDIEKALQNLFASVKYESGDYLFKSQRENKEGEKVWSVPYASNKVKSWCKEINLKGNYASHTLRKTWGYHQFRYYNTAIPYLMEAFNHSNQKQTLDYLTIENAEMKNIFMNCI